VTGISLPCQNLPGDETAPSIESLTIAPHLASAPAKASTPSQFSWPATGREAYHGPMKLHTQASSVADESVDGLERSSSGKLTACATEGDNPMPATRKTSTKSDGRRK